MALLASSPSEARSQAIVEYSQGAVFSAALRYLRVDLDYKIVERDPEAAYLLFEVPLGSGSRKLSRGAVEVVQRDEAVAVFVSLSGRPEYEEEAFSRGLLSKLRAEYGEPPARKPETRKPETKDEPDKETSGSTQ